MSLFFETHLTWYFGWLLSYSLRYSTKSISECISKIELNLQPNDVNSAQAERSASPTHFTQPSILLQFLWTLLVTQMQGIFACVKRQPPQPSLKAFHCQNLLSLNPLPNLLDPNLDPHVMYLCRLCCFRCFCFGHSLCLQGLAWPFLTISPGVISARGLNPVVNLHWKRGHFELPSVDSKEQTINVNPNPIEPWQSQQSELRTMQRNQCPDC